MLTTMLRRLAGTGLTALSLATAACGSTGEDASGPAPLPADVTGTYALTGLRTLGRLDGGGDGLPVSFTDGAGSTLTFHSGRLVLGADGGYTLEVATQFNGIDVTMTDEGLYQLHGATIDFQPTGSPGRMASGTVNGRSITAETRLGGILFEIYLSK